MALIEPGQAAPAFEMPDQSGRRHSLAGYRGKALVLYFYPKDDTPGCTKEACGFRDSLAEFERRGAVVAGVSPDGPKSHEQFAGKFGLKFSLLADVPDKAGTPRVCNAYGVWQEKESFGTRSMGVVRTTYLIDAQGRVARRWDRVRVDAHVDEVLEALGSLG
jgi:thioredoxin-dependent peroxiredoxin